MDVLRTFSPGCRRANSKSAVGIYDREKGIGYTLARTTIHRSDFSSESYTYVKEGDKELKTFSIDHDKQHRIPLLQQAIRDAGGKLTLLASRGAHRP